MRLHWDAWGRDTFLILLMLCPRTVIPLMKEPRDNVSTSLFQGKTRPRSWIQRKQGLGQLIDSNCPIVLATVALSVAAVYPGVEDHRLNELMNQCLDVTTLKVEAAFRQTNTASTRCIPSVTAQRLQWAATHLAGKFHITLHCYRPISPARALIVISTWLILSPDADSAIDYYRLAKSSQPNKPQPTLGNVCSVISRVCFVMFQHTQSRLWKRQRDNNLIISCDCHSLCRLAD